ncbi:MAG: hypothetical protein AAB391_03245 [Patescibacteria group bacterium]
MTNHAPVGVGERDEEFLAWQVEDSVNGMLGNESRKAGSIQVWLDLVQTDFAGVVRALKADLKHNKGLAELELDRRVQLLGTDEEAQIVLWAVHGRLLQHIEPRNVAASLEPQAALAA